MKNLSLVLALSAALVAGCSTSPKAADAGTAPAAATQASAPEPSADEVQKMIDQARAMAGLPPESKDPEAITETRQEWIVVDDAATGKKLQRIPKSETLYVADGNLRHALLNPKMFSLPLVREDELYYFVEAPRERSATSAAEAAPSDLKPIRDVPASEYEVVTPRVSGSRIRFEEKSEGLPRAGYWRTNMALADLDGDGAPEIVTPPPRLASTGFRIFRYADGAWTDVPPELEVSPGTQLAYGGVAVGDVDGDGKLDIVSVGHGAGPTVAFNRGGFRFRLESRGLPAEMSSRAVALGDLNRDGRLDILAISDEPEAENLRQAEARRRAGLPAEKAPSPPASSYKRGIDLRAFLARPDGTFNEMTAGAESACYAYTLALSVPPASSGKPYFVSGCRYSSGRAILFEWDNDSAGGKFVSLGRSVAEGTANHAGAAVGTLGGKPAAFVSYIKGNVPGAGARPTRGYGLSAFTRDGAGWTARRIVKVLSENVGESQGLGVGDLNGDGLDDVAWADDVLGRVRVFFQTAKGELEELDAALQPKYPNHSMSVQIADVDRDGRNDIVVMFEFRSSDASRAGGLKFFRNAG